MSEIRDYLEGIQNAEIPIKRRNPQTGEMEDVYFYYDDDREELVELPRVSRASSYNHQTMAFAQAMPGDGINFNYDSINRLKKIAEFRRRVNSGEYRTLRADIPEDWGKKTEKALNNYLTTKYKAPDYEQYNRWKKNMVLGDNILSVAGYPKFLEKIYGAYTSFKDFDKNKDEMELLGLEGSDKFFHCKANYEASKRGSWESEIARRLSEGREILQYLAHTDSVQGSADDMEANRRGREGAQSGKSLEESCSRNPYDYYK